MEAKDLACIILAAGAGRRFGCPKWKAEFNGKTFLDIIAGKLNSVDVSDIVCVVRKSSMPQNPGIKYALNLFPEQGMFSSLYYGIRLFPHKKGFVILPVDHPFFEISTLKKIISSFSENFNCVVKPICNNKGGHPVILPQELALNIPKGDFAGGLKRFISKSDFSVCNVSVDDRGILRNINFKQDI